MREIRFRAWLEEKKKMIKVDYCQFIRAYIGDEYGYYYFADVEIMQFTGLSDKSGTPIYEGDIVETVGHNGSKELAIVSYSDGCFNVGYHCGSSTKRSPMLLHSKKIKVVGNIYENEDLLGKVK